MERPEIENFILDGLPAAHAEYRAAPGLFRYSQALDNYIDWILEGKEKQALELKNNGFYTWIPFDFNIIQCRPNKTGRYLICRKDGKIHWETWNGSGWAYNHNEIRFWALIVNPLNV